jgi:Uma2 family endonuclease
MIASNSTVIQKSNSTTLLQWKPATWEEYLTYRDHPTLERIRLFFNRGQLLIDMGSEGINHASVSDLFTMLLVLWFSKKPELTAASFGRCLIEKPNTQAASPDLVLYIGEGIPQWKAGETRRIDLTVWRVPDLVGEVSDTTLATDLDEKKQLYAELGIPEYWVINVRGLQVIAFRLQENGKYQEISQSVALENLPIALLEQTLEYLNQGTNVNAALWFSQQISDEQRE